MSKKNLLCLIPGEEIKSLVISFFVKLDFEIEFLEKELSSYPEEKFLKCYGLIINAEVDILSLEEVIGKYFHLKLISYGNISDLISFVSFNGKYIIDPLWSKYEWSFPYWKRLLHSESSIHLQEYLGSTVKEIKNKKLFNFFKVGIQVDEIIVSLSNLKLNFIAIRSFIDHLFLFAQTEKNKNLGNLPMEIEYKSTENGFYLLANFFSKPLDQEHFLEYFETKKFICPEDGLLLLCAKLCDAFSITHDQEKKLTTVTAVWVQKLKNQVIETPSLVFEIFKSQKTEKIPENYLKEKNTQQVDWSKNNSLNELKERQEELSNRNIPSSKAIEINRTNLDSSDLKEIFFNDREQMRQISEFTSLNFELEKPGALKTELDSKFLLKILKNYPYIDEIPKDLNEIDYARLAQLIIKDAWSEIPEKEKIEEKKIDQYAGPMPAEELEKVTGEIEKELDEGVKISGTSEDASEYNALIGGGKEEQDAGYQTIRSNIAKKDNEEITKFVSSMKGNEIDSQNMVSMIHSATKETLGKSDFNKFISNQKISQKDKDQLFSFIMSSKGSEIDRNEIEKVMRELNLNSTIQQNLNDFFKVKSTPVVDVDKIVVSAKDNNLSQENIDLMKDFLAKKNEAIKKEVESIEVKNLVEDKGDEEKDDKKDDEIDEEKEKLIELIEKLKEENLKKDELNLELTAEKINKELNIEELKNNKVELKRDKEVDYLISKISDKLASGENLEKSDAQNIMKVFAQEREFQDRARELEKQHRLALMAFDKKDVLYKNELEDYKRKIKQKEILLKQAHEGIQAAQAQKDKSLSSMQRTINELKQQTSQNSVNKLEVKMQLLERDKKSMLKTIEMYKEKLLEANKFKLQNQEKQNTEQVNYKEIATRAEANKKRLEVKAQQLESEKMEIKKELYHKDDQLRKLNAQNEVLNKRVLMAELKMKEALDKAKDATSAALKEKVNVKDAGLTKVQEQLARVKEEARRVETDLRKELAKKDDMANLIKKNLLNETNKVKILEDKIKELEDKTANTSKNGVGADGKNIAVKPEAGGTMLKMAEEAKKKLMKDLQDQTLKLAETKKEADKMKRTAAELQSKLSAAEAELAKLKKSSVVTPIKDAKENIQTPKKTG